MNDVSSECEVEISAFSNDELGWESLVKTIPLAVDSSAILDGVCDLDAEFEEHLDDGDEFKFSIGISSLLTTLGLASLDLGVFD